ncbi:MAG TPA: methyltransferase domain-containing protein, partial [Acidimicrobiales bacterium]|nr:methyltransferase domain-containing protein [Acidimicrobiales bacterium]
YNRFANEREQPFWDLVALVQPVDRPTLVDLGCGDGRLTVALHDRLGAARTLGIDSSTAMLEGAAAHATEAVTFERGDIGSWFAPSTYDILFANASLQWVPDHDEVFRRLVGSLRPGGQLAVQMPSNADQATHRVAAELAAELFDDPPPDPVAHNVLAPEAYASLLDALGVAEQHVRLQVYAHHLGSSADVVEWVKGTTLTRFKDRLGASEWERFVERYRERLLSVIGSRSPHFFPFKRILVWGRLAA